MILDPTMFGGPNDDLRGGLLGGMGAMAPQQPRGISPDMLVALGAGIAGGRDWGSGIGAGLQGALGAKQNSQMMDLKRQQIASGGLGPALVQEYNFAKQNGFQGSFPEYLKLKQGGEKFGMNLQTVRDAQGNLMLVQPSAQGGVQPVQLPEGYSPTQPVTNINLGTSSQPVGQRTGLPVAPAMPIDVAGAASQGAQGRVTGEAEAKAKVDLPKVMATADLALKTVDQIRNHPGKYWGTGMTSPLGNVPGTNARGFKALVDQAKGQTFLQAFESLKGGGQISNIEGIKGEQARARLDTAQTQEDFDAALNDLEELTVLGINRARKEAGLPPLERPPVGQRSTPAPMAPQNTKDQSRVGGSGNFRIIGVE